jgi:hypothetical protein
MYLVGGIFRRILGEKGYGALRGVGKIMVYLVGCTLM